MVPPLKLDGARVLEFAKPPPEGFGHYQGSDGEMMLITFVAIATYDDLEFYLFSCDEHWNVVGDQLYASREEARNDALRWYQVKAIEWIKA